MEMFEWETFRANSLDPPSLDITFTEENS